MHLYREFLLLFLSISIGIISFFAAPGRVNAQQNQRLVESVKNSRAPEMGVHQQVDSVGALLDAAEPGR